MLSTERGLVQALAFGLGRTRARGRVLRQRRKTACACAHVSFSSTRRLCRTSRVHMIRTRNLVVHVNVLIKMLGFIGILMLLASLVEALVLHFVLKRAYDWRAAGASLLLLPFGRILAEVVPIAAAMPGAYWLYQHRLLDPQQHGGWYYLLLFVALEFTYYWWHRLSHRCRWFWLHHAVHHSPNQFNLAVAYRLGITGKLMGGFFIFTPMAWLGFEPTLIFIAYYVNLSYQFWIHAEWVPRLGPLEGILNTASAHRVHHAANVEYLDANYGGMLVIFDRLFGTYCAEREDVAIRYGLVHPLQTYNPVKIALHQFGPLLQDLRGARNWREATGFLFGPPGWRPDGQGSTTEQLRARVATPDAGLDEVAAIQRT
jgi:sterol desaturase/sphingolipid hydroxylase (fatty acid hydroxylase superfamily)